MVPSDGHGSTDEFSVFIGDLAPDASERALVDVFLNPSSGMREGVSKHIEPFQSCISANIVFDHTGERKGFAFVRFSVKADMIRALSEMNGILCCGRPIRVSPAMTRRERASSLNMSPLCMFSPRAATSPSRFGTCLVPDSPNAAGEGFPAPMSPLCDESWILKRAKEFTRLNKLKIKESFLAADPSNTTVFIGNLDPAINEGDLAAAFNRFGPTHYIKIPPGKRVGFVQFHRKVDAIKAIEEMHCARLCGCDIRVSWGESHAKAANAAVDAQVEEEAVQLALAVIDASTPKEAEISPPGHVPTASVVSSPSWSNEVAGWEASARLVSPGLARARLLDHPSNRIQVLDSTFGTSSGWGRLTSENGAGLGLNLSSPSTEPPGFPAYPGALRPSAADRPRNSSLSPFASPFTSLPRSQSFPLGIPAIPSPGTLARFGLKPTSEGRSVITGHSGHVLGYGTRPRSWTIAVAGSFLSPNPAPSMNPSTRSSLASSLSWNEVRELDEQQDLDVAIVKMVDNLVEDSSLSLHDNLHPEPLQLQSDGRAKEPTAPTVTTALFGEGSRRAREAAELRMNSVVVASPIHGSNNISASPVPLPIGHGRQHAL